MFTDIYLVQYEFSKHVAVNFADDSFLKTTLNALRIY